MKQLKIKRYINFLNITEQDQVNLTGVPMASTITFRRRLQLLGMQMMSIAAKQRGIKVTDYPNTKLGFVNPRACSDLKYEYLSDRHVKIHTVFGDVGEIEEVEYGEEG